MTLRTLLAAFAVLLLAAAPVAAQEACKMTQVAKPLSLADMYKMAAERATAWKPDAKLASMGTTTLGLLKPDFFRDGAALYSMAKQHGEALLAQGYGVMLGTAAAPGDRHSTWRINYHKEGAKDGGLHIVIDANTGKLEKVLN